MKPLRSILTAGLALAVLSTAVRAETFPIFEDAAGSPVTGTIAKAAGTAKTLPVSARSTAFINFLVSSSGLDPDSVTAARLVIFLPRASATGTLSIQNLTSGFTETIAGRSIPTPTIGATLDTVDLAQIPLRGDYFISDITAQVKAWLTTPASEFGIAITSDGVATAALASKEGAGSGHPAFIEVDVNRSGGSLSGTTLALTSTAIVNGNLGIGLMNPAKPLHVLADGSPDAPFGGPGPSGASTDIGTASAIFDRNGHNTVAINAGDGRFSQLLFGRPTAANNGSILYNDFGDFGMTFSTKQGNMTLTNSGKFGIGTTTPTSSLDVRGASGTLLTLSSNVSDVDQAQGIAFAIPATVGTGIPARITAVTRANDANEINFFTNAPSGTDAIRRMIIDENGNVGIGTTPTRAKLEVLGSVNTAQGVHGFLGVGGAGGNAPANTVPASIFASNSVLASSFEASSDQRIKRIEGRSDAAGDLETLRGIEVTDYSYIDTVSKGSRQQKKVIAQQVEAVYPQAVSLRTDVVPDIYRKGSLAGGWVTADTDLKVGERVRLIGKGADSVEPVLEVKDGAFRTAFAAADGDVFVYGREVKDFRTVDYEAIAMLNVSATQELARKLEAKDAEIAALKAANLALAEKLAAFDEKLTTLQAERDERPARTVRASLDLK